MERMTYDYNGGIYLLKENDEYSKDSAIDKLGHYETEEEQGLLVHLPCKTVYHIVDENTKYGPMVTAKRIVDLKISEIMGIDKDGKYWSAREKAEENMKQNCDVN